MEKKTVNVSRAHAEDTLFAHKNRVYVLISVRADGHVIVMDDDEPVPEARH